MRAGERALGSPELVDDPLALFRRADLSGFYRAPAGDDPGNPFPVADRSRGIAVYEIAYEVIDLLCPLNLSHDGRD